MTASWLERPRAFCKWNRKVIFNFPKILREFARVHSRFDCPCRTWIPPTSEHSQAAGGPSNILRAHPDHSPDGAAAARNPAQQKTRNDITKPKESSHISFGVPGPAACLAAGLALSPGASVAPSLAASLARGPGASLAPSLAPSLAASLVPRLAPGVRPVMHHAGLPAWLLR
eukprot:gene13731-biopygen3565